MAVPGSFFLRNASMFNRIDQNDNDMVAVVLSILFDEKSETVLRRRIKFSVDTQSPIFHWMKIESVSHCKLKTTLMV